MGWFFFDTPLRTASMRKVRIGHQKLFRAKISIITIPNSINEEWTGKNIVAIAVRKPQRNKRVNLIKNILRRKFHCPLNLSRLRLRNDVKMIARSLSEFFCNLSLSSIYPFNKKRMFEPFPKFFIHNKFDNKKRGAHERVEGWIWHALISVFFLKQFW